ncbi:hypothetical protein [Streptomyces sp. URMC 129]|uniref:hypothetical protein n=1 Tax=Streptomyces sp. URMC 129 TaxID=3423407 RepID=UPI003F1D9B49
MGQNHGLVVTGDVHVTVARRVSRTKRLGTGVAVVPTALLLTVALLRCSGTGDEGSPPVQAPATDQAGTYVLKESNNPFTSDNDKLDIDTGLPGHGSQPQIRPNAGGLADLIMEPERLHTPDDEPRLMLTTGSPTDLAACDAALSATPANARGSIPHHELTSGAVLCVRTDLGLTATVEIQDFTPAYPASLTIVVRTPDD